MANQTEERLLSVARRFFETDPMEGAHTIETMETGEAAAILEALPASASIEMFRYLQADDAADLLKEFPTELFTEIVEGIEPAQCADIFASLSDSNRATFLERLPRKTRREIQELLSYPEDSAGRIMSREFIAFHTNVKVRDTIQRLRLLANRKAPASYTYVVDEQKRLTGIINMRDLVIAGPDETLGTIMRKDIYTVSAFMDREQLAEELSNRRFFAVPVVDQDQRLLGVIQSDRLIEHVQEEATEDIQKLFGAGGDEKAFSPILFSLRKRLPWLYVNLATAFLAASVVSQFEGIIAKLTILAVFLPVVAGQGGNAGIQTLTIVMRGLVMREIRTERVWTLLGREALIGIVTGVMTGVATGLIAWFWYGNPYLGIVIGLAMIVSMVTAGLSGAAIPLSMKAVGLDPAQSSGIILTTATDVVGFFVFLGLAVLFQAYLI